MAINPGTLYVGKINAPDANYTYGSARDITVSGDGTGTPWVATNLNDVYGFHQRLLTEAGIVPSGNPETILASQYFNSLSKIFGQRKASIAACDTDAKIVVGSYIRTESYYAGLNRGGSLYKIVAAATGTDDGGSFIDLTASGHQLQLIPETPWITPYQFGAKGDGITDDTTVLDNAYDYIAGLTITTRFSFYLQAGKYKTTAALNPWDAEINVFGDSSEKSIIAKSGNYNTITIISGANDIRDFLVSTTTGAIIGGDTGHGIVAGNASGGFHGANMTGVKVQYQGGNGILQTNSTGTTYRNISTRFNGSDGFKLDAVGGAQNCNDNHYMKLDTLGNGGRGFYATSGDSDYNTGYITAQQNDLDGVLIESDNNDFTVYGEVNDQTGGGVGAGTYHDVSIASGAIRNTINVVYATSEAAIYDEGTNTILTSNTSGTLHIRSLGPRTRDTNAAGRGITLFSGSAGAGATGYSAGSFTIETGAAAGTTGDGNGGDFKVTVGAPVNSGRYGYIELDTGDNSSCVIGGVGASNAEASLELKSTVKALLLNPVNGTGTISSPTGGMIMYDTSTSKVVIYEGGVWKNVV